jgi:uncharacterized protein (TIGR00251 family)
MMKSLIIENLLKCISKQDDGVLVNIEVKPQSKISKIEGIDEWRGCLKVRIKAKAQRGKANKEVVQFFSYMLSLPASDLVILDGKRSTRKTIKILNITQDELIKKIINKINSGLKIEIEEVIN